MDEEYCLEPETEKVIEHICALWPPLQEAAEDPYARGLLSVFSNFATGLRPLIDKHATSAFTELFNYLEDRLNHGCEEVQDAIATCLLESLLNLSDEEPERLRPLMQLLGPECRAYCIAFNEFQGIKTIPW